MDLLILVAIVVVVLAAISVLAYLRRIATATERIADALERQPASRSREGAHERL